MNVESLCESYCDLLPPEIQQYIIQLKVAQERIDAEQKMMRSLTKEIVTYAKLKQKWGVRYIQCIPKKKPCFACGKHHVKVFGYYVNNRDVKKSYYLRSSMNNAIANIEFVNTNYF